MRRSMKNRFDVQVAFPDITYGIKNRADVELTPLDVVELLEEFCTRTRKNLARGNQAGTKQGPVTPSASAAP